ncbi:MAG: BON domain-containing protein [Planctomycetota bacterium]|nr:MAG: BON domain-containing protein [Planctomycetota bacterium]
MRWNLPVPAVGSAVLLTMLSAVVPAAVPALQTDQAISDKVEDELRYDLAVNPDRIDVTTLDGVVTLDGRVTNLLAKRRAEHIAETVKGVRAVVNRVEVRFSAGLSDSELKDDVRAALSGDPATEDYDVRVDVRDGVVLLRGTVDSWQQQELAERVVAAVRGVTEVRNLVAVDSGRDRTDQEIEEEVVAALQSSVLIDDGLIDVEVDDRKVMLSGSVGSAAERRLTRVASWVIGVEEVDASELEVEPWARDEAMRKSKYVPKSEEEIREAVRDALAVDPRVSFFEITPDVVGSLVTLRGTVDNLKAKRAAAQDARNTVGVSAVTNRLKVRTADGREDLDIAADVRDSLARDSLVERHEIFVNVSDGTAYLSGAVDTALERAQADDAAARVRGVVSVDNNLTVSDDDIWSYAPYVDTLYPYSHTWYDFEPRYSRTSDAAIESEIKSEMWWSPFVDADQVEVTVEQGVVTLSGEVDSWNERSAAEENAYEGGATRVVNNVTVAGEADSIF